ncbi:MAG: sugar phosphate isomerase/epimerase family protein [Bryobacterales bacterium]
MTNLTRREALTALLGALSASHLRAATRLDASALGANTAITGYDFFQAVELIRKLGFPAIEIHPMGEIRATPGRVPGFEFDRLSSADKKRMRQALKGFQRITSHLPYTDLKTFSSFGPIRDFSRSRVETALEGAAYFGSELCVLHAESAPLDQTWDERLALYRGWGDAAQKHGMKIAIETGFPGSIHDFVRMIKAIDHSSIGATLDVGHQKNYTELTAKVPADKKGSPEGIRAYNDANIELVEKLGDKLFHLHIHDIEPDTWAEHKPLVHGFVDYPRLIAALRKIGYSGLLMFEIGGPADKMPDYLAEAKRKLEGWLA